MKSILRSRLALVAPILLASSLSAQQTGLAGRVTDATGAVLPNATVVVKQVGAFSYKTKTSEAGTYRIPSLTAGDYDVTVSATNFNTVETKISVLVGQTPEIETVLSLQGSSTEVIVTTDDRALDLTSSTVAGNITPGDVRDIPINGRNYMELATLVPGVRVNAITNDTPLGSNNSGKFQISLDGLQVTQDTADASFGQPRFSPDAISQFQIITNRFDATLGRSSGVYVNVQSKTGSDNVHGSAFGYFRDDAFNAGDPVVKAANLTSSTYTNPVTKLSDQQFGGTLGGPIRHSKLWYFGSYEGEHQVSGVPNTPLLPGSLTTIAPQTIAVREYLGREDWQPSERDHIFVRQNGFNFRNDNAIPSGNTDPSGFYSATRMNYAIVGDWDRQVNSKLVNDIHIGLNHFEWQNLPKVPSMAITLGTVTVGGPYNYPQIFYQTVQQYREDVFYLAGKHSIRAGAEFLHTAHTGYFQQNVRGTVTSCATIAKAGFTPAQVAHDLFPNGTTDYTRWNFTNLHNTTGSDLNQFCANGTLTLGQGNFNVDIPRNEIGLWLQDDWKVLPRLTINLGVRYDNDIGAFDPSLKLNNGILTPRSNDNNNVAPRLGLVYDPTGSAKTVLRGGAGLFFADVAANQTIDMQIFNGVTSLQNSVTGNAATPLNLVNPFPSSTVVPRQAVQPLGPNVATPYSLQLSAGIQRELPLHTLVTADFVHSRTYHDWVRLNSNLLQNPANPQYNLSPGSSHVAGSAAICPSGGLIPDATSGRLNVCAQAFTTVNQFFTPNEAGSIYDALQLGVRQSLSHGLASGVAYTYSRYKNSSESPFYFPNKPFLSGVHDEWANAQDDQRHTLTVNGSFTWRYGLSLSNLFHFGSGNAFATSVGTTQPTGYVPSTNRTFGSGVVPVPTGRGVPCSSGIVCVYNNPLNNYLDSSGFYLTKRDALYGRNVYRLDTRLQERVKAHENLSAVVAVEAFNLLNHSNFGSYNSVVTNPLYGTPIQTTSAATGVPVEWRPRSLQFLVRVEF